MCLKQKKLSISNLRYLLIIMFLPVNMFMAQLGHGEGLLTLYTAYSAILYLFYFAEKRICDRYKMKKSNLCIIIVLTGLVLVHVFIGMSSVSQIITYALCIFSLITYSETDFQNGLKEWLANSRKTVVMLQCIYLVGVLTSVLFGDGISYGLWGTTTLKGPYSINHLFAYELFAFLLINLFYWVKDDKLNSFIWVIFFSCLIVLTGVRSTLIVVFFAVLFAFNTKNIQKQFIIAFFGGILLIYFFSQTDLFKGLIEKTVNSAMLGSASGGRGKIFSSSLGALFNSENYFDWVIGMGLDKLSEYNWRHISMRIHAHNDFIDVLVQYGIVGLCVFIYVLGKFIKRRLPAFLLIFVLAFFNGFYMYQSIVILAPIIIIFSERVSMQTKRKLR